MADFSVTVSNSVNVFGPAPSTKWGVGQVYTMTWGTSKWGEGTEDLPVDVNVKLITNNIPSDFNKTASDVEKVYSETMTPQWAATEEELKDGSGYFYIFPDGVTNPTSATITQYTSNVVAVHAWTSGPVTSTIWSN